MCRLRCRRRSSPGPRAPWHPRQGRCNNNNNNNNNNSNDNSNTIIMITSIIIIIIIIICISSISSSSSIPWHPRRGRRNNKIMISSIITVIIIIITISSSSSSSSNSSKLFVLLLVVVVLGKEYSSMGYGLRFSTEVCGSGRERFSTKTYRKLLLFLQKSPKVSGSLREVIGECSLGFLYSSSLLRWACGVRLHARHMNAIAASGCTSGTENHNCHPQPHYRASCMKYFEGSIRPTYMYRPRKYVIPGP